MTDYVVHVQGCKCGCKPIDVQGHTLEGAHRKFMYELKKWRKKVHEVQAAVRQLRDKLCVCGRWGKCDYCTAIDEVFGGQQE